MSTTFVLTGGGTAGHVTPNIALLPALNEAGYDVHYIGTRDGIERELISSESLPYYTVPAGKFRRYIDWQNFTDLFRIKLGFLKSFFDKSYQDAFQLGEDVDGISSATYTSRAIAESALAGSRSIAARQENVRSSKRTKCPRGRLRSMWP